MSKKPLYKSIIACFYKMSNIFGKTFSHRLIKTHILNYTPSAKNKQKRLTKFALRYIIKAWKPKDGCPQNYNFNFRNLSFRKKISRL